MTRILLLICLSFSLSLHAQGVFRDVTAVQYGDSILLDWTLTAGSTCFDMQLQRTDGSASFATIFSVPGVCGGADDQYYNFIDYESLQSGITYQYRVTASNDSYASDTVYITYIDAGAFTLFMYPNPAMAYIDVTIDNSLTPSFLVEIYDLAGRQCSTSMYPGHLITLPISDLSPGMYNLVVTTRDGQQYASDFIVQ